MNTKYLGVVDSDSILYRVAYTAEDDTLDVAKDSLRAYIYENIYKPTKCKEYVFCFSAGCSRRDEKAVTKPYKGNRTDNVKPRHLDALKSYAVEFYNGILLEPYEADDLVIAIADLYKDNTVIIGIDKDALQMEGTHFNFVKNEWKEVSQNDAAYYLAYQMLVGDSVDNIQGVPKIGKVKAHTLLTGSDEPYMKTVWDVYKKLEMTTEQYLEHIFLLKMQKDIVHPFEKHFINFSALKDTGVLDEFDF